MSRLYVGATAYIQGNTVIDARTGDLVDPGTLTFHVLTPAGDTFDLVYGVAPTSGDDDAVIRTAEGTYDLQIAITEERGEGVYEYTMETTGGRGARPTTFTVYARRV